MKPVNNLRLLKRNYLLNFILFTYKKYRENMNFNFQLLKNLLRINFNINV